MHAVDAYEVSLRERGLAAVSVARTRAHLDALLQLEKLGGRMLTWLTPARAKRLYEVLRTTPTRFKRAPSVDSHRNALAAGRSFGRYASEQGWLSADPFAEVKPVGRRRKGKPQLHVDETRKLLDVCIAERSRESIAVACCFMYGAGASEVVSRDVRDLDDGGRLLHVTKGKNRYRVRTLETTEDLRELLLEFARGRRGTAPLFGVGDFDRPTRHWLYWHCRRLCRLAKVPEVSPHGLRGTHVTIALGAVATSHSVRAALAAAGASAGHAPDSPITASTYAAPGSVAKATQKAALAVIQGGRR